MSDEEERLPRIGWREFLSLPDLGVRSIKVKVDTGARSSSLHAYDIEPFERDGVRMVRFQIHPLQHSDKRIVTAEAEILDQRHVRSSSGEATERYFIRTTVAWNGQSWPIELTLANRDQMGFRMLLGREAIRGRLLVDSGCSYLGGLPPRRSSKS